MKGVMIYAMKYAAGSSSAVPVAMNVDDEIKVADA